MKSFLSFLTLLLCFSSSYAQVEYGIELTMGYSHSVFPAVIDGAVDFSQTPPITRSRKNRFYGASIGAQFSVKLPTRNLELGIQSFYTRSFHPSFEQVAVNRSSLISYDMGQVSIGPAIGCYVGEAKRVRLSAGLPITILSHYNRDSEDFAGSNFSSSREYKGRASVGISSAVDYELLSTKRGKWFLGLQFFGDSVYPKSLTIKRSSDPEDVFIEFESIGRPLSTSEPNTTFNIQLHRLQLNLRYVFQVK